LLIWFNLLFKFPEEFQGLSNTGLSFSFSLSLSFFFFPSLVH
jgi:hypothetical protein